VAARGSIIAQKRDAVIPRQPPAGESPGPAASRKGKQVLAGRANSQQVPDALGRSGNDDDTYLSLRCSCR